MSSEVLGTVKVKLHSIETRTHGYLVYLWVIREKSTKVTETAEIFLGWELFFESYNLERLIQGIEQLYLGSN